MTGQLFTRAPRGSIAEMDLCGPPRWLIKSETIVVQQISPEQHYTSGTPPRLRRQSKEETIPAIQQPRGIEKTGASARPCCAAIRPRKMAAVAARDKRGGEVAAGVGKGNRKRGACVSDGRARRGQGHASRPIARVRLAANVAQSWAVNGSKADTGLFAPVR
jgi:hypothetical protein